MLGGNLKKEEEKALTLGSDLYPSSSVPTGGGRERVRSGLRYLSDGGTKGRRNCLVNTDAECTGMSGVN